MRISRYLNWYNPAWTVAQHISDLRYASHGYANYVVAQNIDVDDFARWPVKQDGFRYDEATYLNAWRTRHQDGGAAFHQPDAINYYALMDEFRIMERVASGEIDEVWHLGPPWDGKWEAVMAGPGAYNSNASPLGGTDRAGRRFVIMGYNFERDPGLMLHSYAHRAEGHLNHLHRHVPDHDNLWNRFRRIELTHPGMAEVGTVHFPPNGERDYDLGNPRQVMSNSDDWYHFPRMTGDRFRAMNYREWGSSERSYQKWWLRHMPHVAGDCGGIPYNWWRVIVDPNTV